MCSCLVFCVSVNAMVASPMAMPDDGLARLNMSFSISESFSSQFSDWCLMSRSAEVVVIARTAT